MMYGRLNAAASTKTINGKIRSRIGTPALRGVLLVVGLAACH